MGLVLAVGWLAGCGRETQSPAPEPRSEVRGEPIRGEPIAARPAVPDPVPGPGTSTGVVTAVVETPKTPPVPAEAERVATKVTTTVTTTIATTVPAVESPKPADPKSAGQAPVGTSTNPLTVGFDKLASFAYALPEGPVDTNVVVQVSATNQIPTTIRALNDQFISLKGFMLPLKVEKGLVTELLIMRDQSMCCYGTVPKINEWVSVKMVGEGVKPVMDQAVTLFGKLKVGEMYENGYLVGIYALDGERMSGPLDL